MQLTSRRAEAEQTAQSHEEELTRSSPLWHTTSLYSFYCMQHLDTKTKDQDVGVNQFHRINMTQFGHLAKTEKWEVMCNNSSYYTEGTFLQVEDRKWRMVGGTG